MVRLYIRAISELTCFVVTLYLFHLLLTAPLPIPADTPLWQLAAALVLWVIVTAAIFIDCIRSVARIVRRDAQKDWSMMLASNASSQAPKQPTNT